MDRTIRGLMAAAAVFWVLVGLAAITGVVELGVPREARAILAVLAFGNGVAFVFFSKRVLRGHRLVDVAAGGLLALNAVLSVTDQMGLLDWVSLMVNGSALVLLAAMIVRLRGEDRSLGT